MKSIIWTCPHCKDIRVSFSREVHTLNSCKCGKCFMDLEEEYNRIGGYGYLKIIKEFDDNDYPFDLELFTCCEEQGFNYWDYKELQNLKEELYIDKYLKENEEWKN